MSRRRGAMKGLALMLLVYLVLALLVPLIVLADDRIEVNEAERPAMCHPQGLPPMPCAFMAAMIQKIVGAGCGERTCPVRL